MKLLDFSGQAVGLLSLALAVSIASAQPTAAPVARPVSADAARVAAQEKTASIGRARAAFKSGNPSAALAALTASIEKTTPVEKREYELGRQLADVSVLLKNDGDPILASQAAALSLARLDQMADRQPPKQASRGWLAAAGLHEHVLGDLVRARQAYVRALALDPANVGAKERIARIDAINAAAAAKAQANVLLKQRAQEGGRK